MKKVEACIWQTVIKICVGVWFIALCTHVGWADGHLQILEKGEEAYLKG